MKINIQEGPAFGAFILGGGVAFLLFQKTKSLYLSIAAGVWVALIDYFVLIWIANWKEGRK